MVDGVVQEVDVATGRVLFQWRCMGAIGLEESHVRVPRGRAPYDAFHINSVDMDAAGDLIVSARHTNAVYKISRATGEVAWRLGGERSSFEMERGTHFALQHDARFEPDGSIRIFDNSSRRLRRRSRVIWVRVDPARRTAELVREVHHPGNVLSGTQANAQTQPNGDLLVGWGSQGRISEFGPEGNLLLDLKLPRRWDTYRAYRDPWVGRPPTPPAIAAETSSEGGTTVYASWNGATEVAAWQVLAGDGPAALAVVGSAPRRGFETQMRLPARPRTWWRCARWTRRAACWRSRARSRSPDRISRSTLRSVVRAGGAHRRGEGHEGHLVPLHAVSGASRGRA